MFYINTMPNEDGMKELTRMISEHCGKNKDCCLINLKSKQLIPEEDGICRFNAFCGAFIRIKIMDKVPDKK